MNHHIPEIENLAHTIPGIIYRIDLQSGIPVFLSDAIQETTGYSAEDILSGKIIWLDLVVDEDKPLVLKSMETDPASPRFSIEYRIKHRSGGIRWLLNRALSVWENGRPKWRDGIILDVSSAKIAALELASKTDQFANLVNSLEDIVLEIDSQGRFSNYYTKDWHSFILPPERLLNKTIREAFSTMTEFASLFENAYQKTRAKKQNQKIEYSFVKDGRLCWFRARFVFMQKTGTVSVMVRDITERKVAELALIKHQQELDLAIRGADLGTWNWHIPTGDISFNERIANMIGYLPHEVNPHITTWENLIHPDDKTHVYESLQAHLNGETERHEREYRLRHKDGKHWVWVLSRSKTVEVDKEGKPVRMSGTFLDISDRKKAELANLNLQFKLEEFKAAINEATIVSIADLKGIIKYANDRFREISHYNLDELVGHNHNIINSGFHPKSFWGGMWKTIRKGNVWRGEVKNRRKDGTYYWVDTFIIPMRNTENKIFEYLSIRNDITEKKENEIRLEKALRKAEESDRLKSAFLANISHEIRTPMNAIMGFAELLMINKGSLTDGKRVEFVKLIHERSQDLLSVVNNILDISKIEAGQVLTVPVAGNIRDLLDRLRLTFKAETFHLKNKNIVIRTVNRLNTSQYGAVADFLRLYQVLNNLLTNAIKFTSKGYIEFGCWLSAPDMLEFWVRDSGMGIPEDMLETIFLPFRQGDETIHQRFGGSGLGLAISKGLVELWGGRIRVESEVGKGSAFYFTMPYVPCESFQRRALQPTCQKMERKDRPSPQRRNG